MLAEACDNQGPLVSPGSGGVGAGGSDSAGQGGTAGDAGAVDAGNAMVMGGASGTAGVAGAGGTAGAGGAAVGNSLGCPAADGSVPPRAPGVGWVNRSPARPPFSWPAARRSPAMAFDAAVGPPIGRTVMYGGYASASPVTDTWEWNGADGTWIERKVSPPSVFDMMATTYDSSRG